MDEPDYITLEYTAHAKRFLVTIRTFNKPEDQYDIKRVSGPFKLGVAQSLALSWAAATHLEIRWPPSLSPNDSSAL